MKELSIPAPVLSSTATWQFSSNFLYSILYLAIKEKKRTRSVNVVQES